MGIGGTGDRAPGEASMSDIKFHRITDCNGSMHGLDLHTSFEAGFSMSEEGGLFLQGRVIDSEGVEIFRSSDLRERAIDRYQNWNPEDDLEDFINAIELGNDRVEPVYFQTPLIIMTIEVQGSSAHPEELGITITMITFVVLSSYKWRDSGHLRVWMLCQRDNLLAFARGLQGDLRELRSG